MLKVNLNRCSSQILLDTFSKINKEEVGTCELFKVFCKMFPYENHTYFYDYIENLVKCDILQKESIESDKSIFILIKGGNYINFTQHRH